MLRGGLNNRGVGWDGVCDPEIYWRSAVSRWRDFSLA